VRAGAASTGNGLNAGRGGGAGRSLSASTPRAGAGSGGSGGSVGSGGGGSSGGGGGDDEQPHPMRLWTLAFAALLVVGGGLAFVRKGSAKSLGASASAAVILALCAKAMVGPGAQGPARVAFGLALLLGIVMVRRFTESKKVMPAGMVAGLSLSLCMGFLVTGL
jgi:uncharacterized membrane protein (UPF0136 family)